MGNHDREESWSIHALIHSSANIEQQLKPDCHSHGSHRAVYHQAAATGNQADVLFFAYRNTGASAGTGKAAWNMVIAAVAIILEKGGGSYGGH